MFREVDMPSSLRPKRFDRSCVAQLVATNASLFTEDEKVSWIDVLLPRSQCLVEHKTLADGRTYNCGTGSSSLTCCGTKVRITYTAELLVMSKVKVSLPISKAHYQTLTYELQSASRALCVLPSFPGPWLA